MNNDKRNFLIKAALVGILGTSTVSYSYTGIGDINVSIWITIMVFMDYFRVILLFWIAFENQMKVKYWIIAGLIGSLIYAISFWIFWGFISPEPTRLLIIIEQLFIGAISAIPIWVILRAYYTKAYLWIGVNAIGYSFIGLYPVIRDLILGIRVINKATSYSFLTVQALPDSLLAIAYALFGLFLGIGIYEILKSPTSNITFEKRLENL